MTTSLLLPFDSDFTDYGTNPKTATLYNGAAISGAVYKYGSGALNLTTANSYVAYSANADFVFGSDDFTIECWVNRQNGSQSYGRVLHFGPYWASTDAFGIVGSDPDAGQKLTFVSNKLGASRLVKSINPVPLDVWVHVAVTRQSGVFRLFLDGVLQEENSSYAGQTIESSATNTFAIGNATTQSGGEKFSGYVDDLRITKGTAHYTANFTPPAQSHYSPALPNEGTMAFPPLVAGECFSGSVAVGIQLPLLQTAVAIGGATGVGIQLPAVVSGVQTAEHLLFNSLTTNLPPVTVQGASGATGFANFPPASVNGASGAICSANLPPVTAFGQGTVGGAFGKANLPPLRVFALGSPSVLNALSASLPPVHAMGQGGAVAKMGIPPLRIEASATVSGIGRMVSGRLPPVQITASALVGVVGRMAGGQLPDLVMNGVGAAVGRAAFPPITIDASATVGVVGRMDGGRLPPVQINASALVGAVGRADGVALPSLMGGAMLAGGGTLSALEFPTFAGGGTGAMGAVGRMVGGVLPVIVGYGTARHENVGRMVGGRLPTLIMPKQNIGRATLPSLTVRATASAGTGHAWTLEWALLAIEAYVMGVDATGEATAHPVTRYTNYPFVQIIRLGDSYYGVAPDGLHRIGGAQDNGTPIPWAMQTHVTDFGSQFHKTVASAYLGGTIGPSVAFSVLTGEHPEQMHTHTNTFTTQLKNHREKFGKGRKARYWAFGLSSLPTVSSNLMLDALDLEVFEMSRRVI